MSLPDDGRIVDRPGQIELGLPSSSPYDEASSSVNHIGSGLILGMRARDPFTECGSHLLIHASRVKDTFRARAKERTNKASDPDKVPTD